MLKKLLSVLLTLVLVLSLAACGASDEETTTGTTEEATTQEETTTETTEEATTETTEEASEPEAVDFTVGLVTDTGGIDDKSFNQGTWEGIVRFAEENGTNSEYLQSESDADYIPNLSTFSDEEYDLIVAAGFLFVDAMTEVGEIFPEQNYLIIDDSSVQLDNVAAAVFAEEQGSFLVGVATALKAQEAGQDTVGFLGGMDFGLIQKFEAGFEAGVAAVDPEMNVLIEYAGSFSDTQIGATLAEKMYSEGAYIIYHAAGSTGNGMIKAAKDRRLNGEDVWAVGVDKDQYDDGIYEGDNSAVLTSMMKRVDVASYNVSEMTFNGNFPGGQVLLFDLNNGGVGLPLENPNLSDEIVATVAEYEAQIIAGEIEVPVVPARVLEAAE